MSLVVVARSATSNERQTLHSWLPGRERIQTLITTYAQAHKKRQELYGVERAKEMVGEPGWRVPVVSNVDAAPYTLPDVARERLREQVCAPVRWVELVRTMRSAGVSVQLEVGPGKVLSGLAARIDRGLARASVATTDEVAPALAAVAEALS